MREKILKIADKIDERADEIEKPYMAGGGIGFINSPGYPITQAMHEIARIIREELM